MSSLAQATPPMTAEDWSRVRRPFKRPYNGPPFLFLADPRKDPRIDAACAAVELDLRNLSTNTLHRYLCWPTDEQVASACGLSETTAKSHIRTLVRNGRVISVVGIRNLARWILEHGAKFGLSFEKLTAAVKGKLPSRNRFLIIVGRLPPIQEGYQWDSLFPINLKSSEDEPAPGGRDSDPVGGRSADLAGGRDSDPVGGRSADLAAASPPICLEERAFRIVVEEGAARHDDESPDSGDGDLEAMHRENLKLPPRDGLRKIAEWYFRNRDKPRQEPARQARIYPKPPEVDPARAGAPTPRQGDRGRSKADSIVRAIAEGNTTPQDGGMALAEAVGDTKPSTVRTYRAGLASLADGRTSLAEALGVIADAFGPKVHYPERLLSQAMADFSRRSKRPDAG